MRMNSINPYTGLPHTEKHIKAIQTFGYGKRPRLPQWLKDAGRNYQGARTRVRARGMKVARK